ncbi:MAG: FAD-binding oxidoreductase [Acidimicrobiales bacterium]
MADLTRRQLLRAAAATALAVKLGACSTDRNHQRALDDLRKRMKGTLLLPGDSGFVTATLPANGRYNDIFPMAVAQCADEADVATCVTWSRENGVPPVSRGGGHSYAGFSTTTGLLINVGLLNAANVDRAAGTAVFGGGALNQNAYDATHDGPLFLPGGTCLGVGLGGLTLGGGIGYQTHWAGLTSDHLLSSRIVTASGEVLEIDPSHDADLFWACRGGAGGNFGINTSFTYKLVEAPANVGFYRFDYRGADAAGAVLSAFHRVLQAAPAAFNAVYAAQATPVGAGGPREAIDVFTRGQYVGPLSELRDLVQPLLAAATPTKTVLQQQTFWDTFRGFASAEPPQHSFGDISRYADRPIPDSAVAQLIDTLAACPSRSTTANGSFWSLGWVGGPVVDRFSRTETAYVHRNMLTLLRPTPDWPDDAPAAVGDDLLAWTDAMIRVVDAHTPAASYQNFPNRRIQNWQQQYYGENFPRLVEVKRTYDRDNLFRNEQSIPTT